MRARRPLVSVALVVASALLAAAPAAAEEAAPEDVPGAAAAGADGARPRVRTGYRDERGVYHQPNGACWSPWSGQLVFGRPLMSIPERQRYREELRSREGCAAKQRFWLEHVATVQRRALALGVSLPEPPTPPTELRAVGPAIFARHLMTLEEREAYLDAYSKLETAEEIEAFEAAHEKKMLERAEGWSMGLRPPGVEPEAVLEAQEKRERLRAFLEKAQELAKEKGFDPTPAEAEPAKAPDSPDSP